MNKYQIGILSFFINEINSYINLDYLSLGICRVNRQKDISKGQRYIRNHVRNTRDMNKNNTIHVCVSMPRDKQRERHIKRAKVSKEFKKSC